ncbi:MAG: carbonic anhydrase [Proteobacteria bacterium]|nr:carbonic anhydrase [Pseudomonadota bacterium]
MQEVKKLIDGYQRFHKKYFEERPELYDSLIVEGQNPGFLVISCCDSRVHPAQVMDTVPGDIFVIRNVANLVPINEVDGKSHGTSAAMEFAIKHLGVKHVIVLGHSQCGGIKSLMEGDHLEHDYGFIDPWMKIAKTARDQTLQNHAEEGFDAQCAHCERASIEISLDNLMTFPWIKERFDAGSLSIHGWYFDIGSGSLLGKKGDQFIPVNELAISN